MNQELSAGSNRSRIEYLIERSSLGTPEAKALRGTVSDELAAAIVKRADNLAVEWEECDEVQCDHPPAAVISDVSGDHFCAVCNAQWWEDPL